MLLLVFSWRWSIVLSSSCLAGSFSTIMYSRRVRAISNAVIIVEWTMQPLFFVMVLPVLSNIVDIGFCGIVDIVVSLLVCVVSSPLVTGLLRMFQFPFSVTSFVYISHWYGVEVDRVWFMSSSSHCLCPWTRPLFGVFSTLYCKGSLSVTVPPQSFYIFSW